ncbi:hypothetical protein ENUP19_0047G0107 [Entamoeba nuttalli]|uniref:Uncharacterized protein n=1 Tax=Entamoeba nuttalli TaxID=412467 RepID=A0ABQ0DB18_9EUKA
MDDIMNDIHFLSNFFGEWNLSAVEEFKRKQDLETLLKLLIKRDNLENIIHQSN